MSARVKSNKRSIVQRLLLSATVVLVLVSMFGCGDSEKVVVPRTPDPFENMNAVGTDSTLEVMTWNIEHFAKQEEITVDHVIHALRRLQVDIIGLQEIERPDYFNRVVNSLEGYGGFQASSAGYDINLAFIYRTSGNLEMTSIYEILNDNNREFPRRPLVFEGTFNGEPIVVINNHFKCCGDGTIDPDDRWDEETRRRDANLRLDQYIQDQYADKAVFVIGDFNDELTDSTERNVFQNFIDNTDHWKFADMPVAEGPESGWSYPTWPSHIDHILISDELFAPMAGQEAGVQVMQLNDYLSGWVEYDQKISDHLPVFVRVKP